MSQNDFITIHEAADITGKSVQTIRRALKSRKIDYKKKHTPQGFNYLIGKTSLFREYGLQDNGSAVVSESCDVINSELTEVSSSTSLEVAATPQAEAVKENSITVTSQDFLDFKKAFETMISNHSEERQNFLRLINNLQEKIFVLENQVSLLQAPKKNWYSFWK